ncbi:MAG: sugar ABC transporter substrate-binding protein [Candidatus Sumerlaeia bacterium]
MMRHVIHPAFLLTAAAALIMAGCGGADKSESPSESGVVEISFLTQQLKPTFDDYINGLVREFESTHPGVRVKWLDFPFQNYETKILTAFVGGNAPDVINIGSESIPVFANGGYLMRLNDLLPPEVFAAYVPQMLQDGCSLGEDIYGLPWYAASTVTLYNTEIFQKLGIPIEERPQSYDEVRAFCEKVRAKSSEYFGFFPIYTEGGTMRTWLLEAGVELYNAEKNRAIFNTPEGVEVVKFWTDLYKDKLVPSEALTATHRRPIELYNTGRLAVFLAAPQFIRQVKSDSPDVYKASMVGQRLHWKNKPPVSIIPLHTFAVSKQTKHPRLAAELAAFLTNDANQLAFCKLTTIFPTTRKALQDPYFTEPEDTIEGRARELSADQISHGRILFAPRRAKEMNQAMDKMTERICQGQITVEAALAELQEQWNELLKD